jgi:hypothetical protein
MKDRSSDGICTKIVKIHVMSYIVPYQHRIEEVILRLIISIVFNHLMDKKIDGER